MFTKLKVFLATSSAGKIQQIKEAANDFFLGKRKCDEVPLRFYRVTEKNALEVDEDANTLVGNAVKKAQAYHRMYGGVVMADDSGIFVTALKGCPGVHSRRDGWKPSVVMKKLKGTDYLYRHAIMQTAVAVCYTGDGGDRRTETFLANNDGHIVETCDKPDVGTYGYDKIFVPHGYDEWMTVHKLLNFRDVSMRVSRETMEYPRNIAWQKAFEFIDSEFMP